MSVKLVADSSANICENIKEDISYVPLVIVAGNKEYVDTPDLDTKKMAEELKAYKGPSSTACPSIHAWLEGFGNHDMVLGTTITSNLSGCYNSAMNAVAEFKEKHPASKIFILDSLSTGPEMELILEKFQEFVERCLPFEEIVEKIKEYHQRTHLVFSLESLDMLAKNGRVSPVLAKAAGILGLRVIGRASAEGTLEQLHKARGEKKAIAQVLQTMKDEGFKGGKVRISHSFNLPAVNVLAELIKKEFPNCDLHVTENRALCSYYAETGGILAGFES